MTETVDDARTATPAKRRPRPKPRRRPQSRNPSAPMATPDPEADATPAPSRKSKSPKRQQPTPARTSASSPARGRTDSPPTSAPGPDAAGTKESAPAPESGPARASGGSASGSATAVEAGPASEATEAKDSGPAPDSGPGRGSGAPASGSATAVEGGQGAGRKAARGAGGSPPDSGKGGDGEKTRPTPTPTARREEPLPPSGPESSGSAATADAPPKGSPGRNPGSAKGPRPRATGARARRALAHTARRLRNPRPLALPPWWPAALCVLLGVLAGLAYGLLRPAQYTATSYVAVVPGEEGDPVTALGFAQAYGRIATDTAVLARAQEESGVPVATLRESVDAVTSPDAPMIEITGHAPRAGEAAAVANAVAGSLTEVADDSAEATGVELTAFSRARAPREPGTPSAVLITAVGGSAGVLVGALVLLVRPRRDERFTRSAVPAPAGEEPAGGGSRPHGPVREKEAVR